jgi:RNA polymerase sigma-70 factor (ECF subfamily)
MHSTYYAEAMYRPDQQYGRTYDQLTDQELIALMSRGEEAALGVIYDRYHRLTYTIALRITHDRANAEEVLQDVFHVVWRCAGTFQAGRSFTAWLIGITRHRAIDATRARNYRAHSRDLSLDATQMTDRAWHVDEQVDTLLLREAIGAALATLTHTQREVIELAHYSGLTCSEIAAELGEPVGTVKSRMRKGLLKLRQALAS